MKSKTKVSIIRLVSAIIILISLTVGMVANAVGNTVYSSTISLADNLDYINSINWDLRAGRTESFSVRLNGDGDAYPIVMNGASVYGGTTISAMVTYAQSEGKNLLAAVNADFFSMSTGVPMGIVIEDGVYKSSPSGWNAICFGYEGGAFFVESPTVEISLFNNGNDESDNYGNTVVLQTFNKARADTGGMYLYSESFSSVSTRTSSQGWFVEFKILEGSPSVSGTMTLEVVSMLESDGAFDINEDHLVLTAASASGYGAEYAKFAIGDVVTLTTSCSDESLENARYATSGGDILVSDGVKSDDSEWDPDLLSKAPRTAFGIRADGSIVSYVVDGRNASHSIGLTLNELADEMISQGCVYAVNLDGGGSSAMSVRLPGEEIATVVSRPSEGRERACATYILFVTDVVSDGNVKNLSLVNNGSVMLAGSSIELNVAATDNGYMPVSVPDDIIALSMSADSSIDGMVFTAGDTTGANRISLYSPSTGAYGMGEVFVIASPTSLTVRMAGGSAPLTSVHIAPGSTLELEVTALYHGRDVYADLNSFTYDVQGDIGEFTEPGMFVAGPVSGLSGSIKIGAGGFDIVISIDVIGFADMDDHWASEYANYLLLRGISNGISDSEYGPSLEMRRGDYILMLYRAAGEPDVSVFSAFDDVPGSMYYTQALTWAKREGIAVAVDGNNFYPQSPITRQDAFVFTFRALDILGIDYVEGSFADLVSFPDAGDIDAHAIVPTATLILLGVVEGADGFLIPRETLTRAQMAKVLAVVLQL